MRLISLAGELINLQSTGLPPATCVLTFAMGEEVVSEGGVRTGVAVRAAEAAGSQGGPPVCTRTQKLCAAGTNQPGRGGVETEKKKEINTGQSRCPEWEEVSVNQESEKGGRKAG